MHITVLKPKICEFVLKITKNMQNYAIKIFVFEIYILWIESVPIEP